MLKTRAFRTLCLIWLGWAITLIGFQALVVARIDLQRPDKALIWTPAQTKRSSQRDRPYLNNPFMNAQVSWDSEYYLSIATVGYNDPQVHSIESPTRQRLALNYAFFPFYPMVMHIVAMPLKVLRFDSIAASTLAGVIVSLLGALGGMLALYDLTREELGEAGGLRTAFYLLIFPSGFFLAQVYTEGLFVGLAFGALALIRRKQLGWAALLAALATWTRAVGVALIVPLAWDWFEEGGWRDLSREFSVEKLGRVLQVLSPPAAYLMWRAVLGAKFHIVEAQFFGRGLFLVSSSFLSWVLAFISLFSSNSQMASYYLIEFGAILLGVVACFNTLKQYPALSLFGLGVIAVSLTSGVAQGMHRYVLAVPSIFIVLSRWGKNEVFDRVWTIGSVLVMGLLATLFSFNMWAG